MPPIFSIILPTYNRAYVLWRAILSVLAQTETRWELIVVDDGSTDCTQRLLEEFKDDRIRSLLTANGGPSAARNLGVQHAHAPYVAYLDSDNVWRHNYLETMAHAIHAHPDAAVWYCGQQMTLWHRSAEGRWTKWFERAEPRAQYTLEDVLDLEIVDANCIVHRREVLDEVGGWDEQCGWMEDWDLFLRFTLTYPHDIVWIPSILVDYRQVHGDGADGICGEAREDGHVEFAARQYLLQKWRTQLGATAVSKLSWSVDDLQVRRERAARKYPTLTP